MSGRLSITTAAVLLALALAPTLALAAPSVVTDGTVKLSVSVDREAAQVAEPIRLTIEVAAPQGTRVQLPELPSKLGDFDVRSSESTKDIPSADSTTTRRWALDATLETIKTGALTIPALDVHYTMDQNSTTFKTLHSKPIEIRITSILENRADPTKFRDIKETVDVALPELHSFAWVKWTAAGVARAAIALALVTFVIVRRRRGPSPAAWAIAAITDLEQLPIKSAAEAEAAYNEVVDVLREFFELEFNVPTQSRTTREFLAQATKVVGLPKTAHERLSALASIADEIKFARLGVGEAQVREAIAQAKAFIDECESHRRTLEKEAA